MVLGSSFSLQWVKPLFPLGELNFTFVYLLEDYLPSSKADSSAKRCHYGFVKMWEDIDTQIQVCNMIVVDNMCFFFKEKRY